jgi:hypothetical protein
MIINMLLFAALPLLIAMLVLRRTRKRAPVRKADRGAAESERRWNAASS